VLAKTYLDYIEAVICSSIHTKTIRLDMSTGEDIIWFKTENNEEVRFEQLSAGQKAVTTLFGDIARRLILLNPKLDNPLEGQGIVLIDEIELHLHPKWQQGVLLNLQKSFPNIQFIVTTHSPQVLSTVDKSCIRKFTTNERGEDVLETPRFQTKGVVSKDILEQIMGTHAEPNIAEARWLDDYSEYISSGKPDDAEVLLNSKIVPHFGPKHPVVLDCLNLKSIHEMKKRLGVLS
jgi:predicted ATP-binding protein involved in virulence